MKMKIGTRIESKYFILSLAGVCDDKACPTLVEALENGARSFCDHVLLDFKNLRNINPTGRQIILSYFSRLEDLQMQLVLFNVAPEVTASFHVPGINRMPTMAPTLPQAKALADAALL